MVLSTQQICKNVKEIEEKSWPQVYTILVVCLNSMLAGLLFAWPSPSTPKLLKTTDMTMEELSYLAIIPPLATVFASPFVGSLIDLIGRKYALLSVTLPYVISLILCAWGDSLWMFYLARIADGIGDACMYSTIPCYVSEIATPKVRGTWGNTVSLSMYLGQLVMNSIGSYLSIPHAAFAALLLPVLFLLNFRLIPESPYYLIMRERTDEARKALQWLRGRQNVDEELLQLSADVKRQQSETGRYVDLILIKSNRKSAFIVMSVRWLQNFCGSSTFAAFIQTIFHRSGSTISFQMSAIIYNATCLVCTTVASMALDRLGRRLSMMLSCTGCCLLLLSQGAVFYIHEKTDWDVTGFDVLPLILMVFYVITYSIGLGIIPTLLHGELFSSSIKSKAYVLMNINLGISTAASSQTFALLLQNYGLYVIFLFYGSCTFVGMILCYFIMPETKGKSLEEIQQQFKK